MGCQLSPDARAFIRVSSSFADHAAADLVEVVLAAAAAAVVIDAGR
jgi:hypothetical protein